MRNPIKWIASYFLLLKAARYQGGGQFEQVIDLSLRAKSLDPKSLMAFMILGDAYRFLKKYEEAKNVLLEATSMYPDEGMLNKLFAEVLLEKGEPVNHAIPYLKIYLRHRITQKGKFPLWMKVMTKLLRKDFDWDAYGDYLDKEENEWAEWAQNAVNYYEQKALEAESKEDR